MLRDSRNLAKERVKARMWGETRKKPQKEGKNLALYVIKKKKQSAFRKGDSCAAKVKGGRRTKSMRKCTQH